MYLLDTNVLSNLMRPKPSVALIARLAQVPPKQQFTASTTVAELIYGAERDLSNRTARLGHIERMIAESLQVLPFDIAAAREHGALRARLEREGRRLADADLQIASSALVHDLTLITANLRHFDRVPALRVENWLN